MCRAVWNMRTDIQRQLEHPEGRAPLPERSVEKLDDASSGSTRPQAAEEAGRPPRAAQKGPGFAGSQQGPAQPRRADRIAARPVAVDHRPGKPGGEAPREVEKLDADIEAAVTGYRRAAAAGSLDELPRETVAVLRRPAQVDQGRKRKARQGQAGSRRSQAGARRRGRRNTSRSAARSSCPT